MDIYLDKFFEPILFLTPIDNSHFLKGNFGRFWRQTERSIISKTGRPRPPKLVCMCFRSTFTCINCLSQFIFWTPWSIVYGSKGNFGCFWKQAKGAITPKPERHAHQNWISMHFMTTSNAWIFEPILFFDPCELLCHGLKGKILLFWRQTKSDRISETIKAMPTYKFVFHAVYITLYLLNFFEPILFFEPHGL